MTFEASIGGFESQLCHILTAQPWASYLPSLRFSLIICKIGIIIIFTLKSTWVCCEGYMSLCLEYCLGHNKY